MLKSKVGVVYQVIMGVSLGGGKDEILLESIPASLGLEGDQERDQEGDQVLMPGSRVGFLLLVSCIFLSVVSSMAE